ncbi:UNVERIFIED_CONTAM: hypothetical protein PYX00_008910 [Menopon gallinae]|uniref:Transketolase-like pyrimidine-binding domain-containing protein n=1 Tax=Menopon gallinae TaxID=328185 RepID=A0AAW2H9F8_9NEOP
MKKYNRLLCRYYQTKAGVFGYIPKKKKKFEISSEVLEERAKYSNFYRLVCAYREHGHKKALVNPFATEPLEKILELELRYYNLHSGTKVNFSNILKSGIKDEGTVEEAQEFLEKKYCQYIAAEFAHLPSEEAEWVYEHFESLKEVDDAAKKELMKALVKSQVFDNFLATKFSTLKRYGAEGAESMMAFFWQLLKSCRDLEVHDIVLGIPHRGRLNLLSGMFHLPPALIFRKIKGLPEFESSAEATGDVLSHLTCSVDIDGVHVTMLPNPSHLEAVNPVSMGKARTKQMMLKQGDYGDGSTEFGEKVVNVQVHGDAAFAGQGVNQETLMLAGIPHFNVGGTVHLVVNNQLGFTTPPDRGRSTPYPTDLAKMIAAPIFHVNGDFPEKVAQVADLAMRYQHKFRKDVFVNMNCYRQWGHNELDDPTFTNPGIYKVIRSRRTVPDTYADTLVKQNVCQSTEVEDLKKNYYGELNDALKDEQFTPKKTFFERQWSGFVQAGRNLTVWDTGFHTGLLKEIAIKSVQVPENFSVHGHLLKTHIIPRTKRIAGNADKIDWATAESMAIGSLLLQGFNVRISGQDVGRGTFSQRHAMFVDQETNDIFIPLNYITDKQQGKLELANSPLSEEAVLGFEYGMSIDHPNNLIIWEAQFGDFFNGAQIIIDTFITSGEMKWMKCSGLTLLLPHGYDGAGPEHSSSRIERFLQLSDSKETTADGDNVNIQVVNPTTPAQYFHVLRRQMIRNYRKPLVVISPKILLRLPEATSRLSEFEPDTSFLNVIDDNSTSPNNVTKLIFTSGKHYYSLRKEREAKGLKNISIVRLESLCPFPTLELQQLIDKYTNAKEFIWSQEEPRNMGAWTFVRPRFTNLVGANLTYVGPDELGTPALVGQKHFQVQDNIINSCFR